ncbi:pilus assembly protein [Stenotrophomonas mori]|uniref:Pilus assembly protein n=1 Tax=Stenotrophomonas mori TaxID=2871096 RepID=A0ABT0SFU9_9GAMM|nr:PilC/PilY family type IV pilus protein [Stenotrophomonas mori]MCL7714192.1 pilus assembly protein [Stenotrophomonas mori]
MNTTHPLGHRRGRPARHWHAGALGFLAGLLALPVGAAIRLPDEPLTTASRVAPNILFILDDSGSMGDWRMYNPQVGLSTTYGQYAYPRNTLWYNPFNTYQPWLKADGGRLTGGTSYNAAFMHHDDPSLPIDLGNTRSCNRSNDNGTNREVCGGVQTFYVPKDPDESTPAYLGSQANYYRYQIMGDGKIYRSEWLGRSGSSPAYNNGPDRVAGGCTTTGTTVTWRDCRRMTPTGRSEDAELRNFATWFSYYRTRMKAAKAGASEAFGSLDGKVRVGFWTLYATDRQGRTGMNIPVADGNDGRFVDVEGNGPKARSDWYARLQSTQNYSSTPLRSVLNRAGTYFSNQTASGPYGPEAGANQYSCRQNFTILSTDGAWNDGSQGVGDADGSNGPVITGPGNKSYQYIAKAPYRDGYSDTLADVAMHYWKRDLRPDLENNVPSSQADPAFWQHMVTFGISIGLKGEKGWGGVGEVPANASWENPNNDARKIDDLLHASLNGRGAFFSAADPAEFTAGLKTALASISERSSSFSNVASNSVSLDTGTQLFSASYVSGSWTGNLQSRGATAATTWSASLPAWDTRRIFTSSAATPGQAGTSGVVFPTSQQVAALTRGGGSSNYEVSGADNAAYLRGSAAREERNGVANLRNRTSMLGDIVNSSPAYVPETNTVYVGANDGMLHAFNAGNGKELFAYVPSILNWNNLSSLSRGDYAHRYFVDGPVVVSRRNVTPGKNILVGALGRGGKGLYALDVTNPGSVGAGGPFKWERNTGNFMGQVLGKPVLAKVQGGNAAVVLGNGVNSTSGRAALIVLNLETGAVIREIDTGAGSPELPNGLSAPVGVYGTDGQTLAYVYAGDLQGNVWKFDVSAASPGSWSATRLFTAVGPNNEVQPISGGLAVARHPTTGKRWVLFGTGRYLTVEDADPSNAGVQSMYGFIDEGRVVANTDLVQRDFDVTEASVDGVPVRSFQSKAALPTGKKGWRVDLPGHGERIVQDAQMVANILITASAMPISTACEAGGTGYVNAIDAFTGTSPDTSFFNIGDGKVSGGGSNPIGSVNLGSGMPTVPSLLDGAMVVDGSNAPSYALCGDEVCGDGTAKTRGAAWVRVSWRQIIGD